MNFKRVLGFIIILLCLSPIILVFKTVLQPSGSNLSNAENRHEAMFWESLGNGQVACQLCPNQCVLDEGEIGLCKARQNIEGKLYSLVYGRSVTQHVDPIEKKPFYHFLPGAKVYSFATTGCNLSCLYCQNWDIAQRFPDDVQSRSLLPEQAVEEAKSSGSDMIAFTYNEPIVWYEYMLDTAMLAKKEGLKTVMVSNGYINPQPLEKLLPYLDAVKIDLKGFNNDYYMKYVGGKLEPVLNTLKIIKDSGVHLEIVTLLVTGKNDSRQEIEKQCDWIYENLGSDIPVHFSRYHPTYKLSNLAPTPEETVKKARQICLDRGLKYVYTGNISDLEGSTTFCPDNQQPLIVRKGYFISENKINGKGLSEICSEPIYGVWSK
jgi:pyruvate formate lyase activating enzyme